MNKAEVLEALRSGRAELDQLIDGLAPLHVSAPLAGGWSIKDHLAHLAWY